jgi:hypothetical protein
MQRDLTICKHWKNFKSGNPHQRLHKMLSKVKNLKQNIDFSIVWYMSWLGWSTFGLVCFSWHGIYLKLRKKNTVVTSWAMSQNGNCFYSHWSLVKKLSFWVKSVVRLWMCSACNKSTFEINPVIQQSKEADYAKCRPPTSIFEWKLSRPEEIQLWLRCSSSLIWNRTLNPRLINK